MPVAIKVKKNQRFGNWTAIEEVERSSHNQRQFNCLCTCGNEKVMLLSAIMRKKKLGCQKCYSINQIKEMPVLKKKYGMLKVIKQVKGNAIEKNVYCECDCGGKRWYSSNNLKSGRSKSCGCSRYVQSKVNQDKTKAIVVELLNPAEEARTSGKCHEGGMCEHYKRCGNSDFLRECYK